MEHGDDTLAVDALIARRAEAQEGVIHFDQLRALGLGVGAIHARARAGRLHRMHTAVFAVGHRRLSRKGHWMAAVLALGEGAALSHVSAAALWGIRPTSSSSIHVTVPTHAGRPHRSRIVVHRSRTLTADDVMVHEGIAVTSIARTALDIAGMLAAGPLERAVERSLTLRLFDLSGMHSAIAANPRHRGARALAHVIAKVHDEPALTRSRLEGLMRDLCDARNLPRPEVNALAAGEEVDFLWRAQRLIVETDGHEFHGTRAAFERDREKDARLTTLGYRVVRFTYRRVVFEPHAVARTLSALLAQPRRA